MSEMSQNMMPAPEESLAELEKILNSHVLQGADSLRAFLKYVVQESIQNHVTHLKEYTIAAEVFGRNTDFDPHNDSIVRVQAARLRSKLLKYYSTEGVGDRVLIDLPKGQYIPVFSYAELSPVVSKTTSATQATEASDGMPPATQAVAPPVAAPDQPATARKRISIPFIAIFLAALVATFLAIRYGLEASRLKDINKVKLQAAADIKDMAPLWSEFFASSEPILIAYSNTRFQGNADTGMKLLSPLDAARPLSKQAAEPNPARPYGDVDGIITDSYTGVGEVMAVYSLGNLFSKADHPFKVKRSLLLNWDDFKTENIVMLGSPAENLLLRQLPGDQDFVFRVLKSEGREQEFGIENLKPRPGEQTTYLARGEWHSTSDISEDFAVVSLLKGLDDNHRLMILAGITTFGTQAAAEYVTNKQSVRELLAHTGSSLPFNCQILLRVKINGGVPVETQYVSHHFLN